MKKTYLIFLAAFILAACTAPPTNRDATSTTNANKPPETKAAVPLTEAEATAKEKELGQLFQNRISTPSPRRWLRIRSMSRVMGFTTKLQASKASRDLLPLMLD